MTVARKLRVATPDSSDALRLVQDGFEEVTGLFVEPELQEVDRGELIVEILVEVPPLIPVVGPTTELVSRAVERSEFDMSVLSGWIEERPKSFPTMLPITAMSELSTTTDHEAVNRAAHDELATSVWCHDTDEAGEPGVWQLAVPFCRKDRSVFVALSERRGYPYRFSHQEVVGFRSYLEMAM